MCLAKLSLQLECMLPHGDMGSCCLFDSGLQCRIACRSHWSHAGIISMEIVSMNSACMPLCQLEP